MNTLVSPRGTALALIAALAYELVFKLAYLLMPAMFAAPGIARITPVLSGVVVVIIVLFLISFRGQMRAHRRLAAVIAMLIGCIVIAAILRLPMVSGAIGYQAARLIGAALGVVTDCLLFLFMIYYLRIIPSAQKGLRQAAVLTSVLFAIGVVISLHALGCFIWFMIFFEVVEPGPLFNGILFLLFILRHASIILFLVRYHQSLPPAKPVS